MATLPLRSTVTGRYWSSQGKRGRVAAKTRHRRRKAGSALLLRLHLGYGFPPGESGSIAYPQMDCPLSAFVLTQFSLRPV